MPTPDELLDLLLKNRGIAAEHRDRFLSPSYTDHLYDPYLLKDMDKAVKRIFDAVEKKEKIIIYSDYDCDGIPAAVIMHDLFTKIGYQNFSVYIPDRHDEGYGLHTDAIEEFIASGVKLIITFDLGITAVEQVRLAEDAGIDVIITDHHLPQAKLPDAYAIINPKQEGCDYPDKMLCGAGLAFKLACALIQKYGDVWNIPPGWEKWLLDMAGVATLADQVPLVDENRLLAYYGLKVLRKSRRPGLAELFRKADVDITKATEEDVTFTLAPRLNAASRMDSPIRAFEVLSTTDLSYAKTCADHLAQINADRKSIVAHIMKDVKKTLREREDKPIIVIGNPQWRIGVLGLIASKIAEEYKKPAFVWGKEGGETIRGSCRTCGNINLVSLMTSLPENSLLEFGGHKSAGGFSVSPDAIHFLEERLLSALAAQENSEEAEEKETTEASIFLDDVTNENYAVIEKLAPYGTGNPKPLFLFENITISLMKEFGKDKNHLELIFRDSRRRPVKAVAFFKTRDSFNKTLSEGSIMNLVATFEKNTFAGRTELRLRIVDIL
ncbi:MAG: single-stranded-DNA-specific exonuclease RecJ [Patescibacteria group bacterium]